MVRKLTGVLVVALMLLLLMPVGAHATWVDTSYTDTANFSGGADCNKTETGYADLPEDDIYARGWVVETPALGTVLMDSGQPVATITAIAVDKSGFATVTVQANQAACDPNSDKSQSWSASVEVTVDYRTIEFKRCGTAEFGFAGGPVYGHGGVTCRQARQLARSYLKARSHRHCRDCPRRVGAYTCHIVGRWAVNWPVVDCWRGGRLVHFKWAV
jgi:hypothetical protein